MTLDADRLVLLGALAGAAHWLVARSTVGRPLWSRARGRLDRLLRCAACCGWWLGLGLGAFFGLRPATLTPGAPGGIPAAVAEVVMAGLLGVVTTPVVEALILWAKDVTAMRPEDDGDEGPR
jgi:hypothetical protein